MKQLVQLQGISSELDSLGYQVLAISPDHPEGLRRAALHTGVTFPLLGDPDMKAAAAMGLAFGAPGRQLPVPAVYVVDREGKILFQYVNPNYVVRLDPRVLLAVARAGAPR